jgi:hypothetical protein
VPGDLTQELGATEHPSASHGVLYSRFISDSERTLYQVLPAQFALEWRIAELPKAGVIGNERIEDHAKMVRQARPGVVACLGYQPPGDGKPLDVSSASKQPLIWLDDGSAEATRPKRAALPMAAVEVPTIGSTDLLNHPTQSGRPLRAR